MAIGDTSNCSGKHAGMVSSVERLLHDASRHQQFGREVVRRSFDP
jgi:L-asparaginase II